MSEVSQADFEQMGGSVELLGKGAYFWVYVSPQNDTASVVKKWVVTLRQGEWSASISSKDPEPTLQTEGMSGVFEVQVEWQRPPDDLAIDLSPLPDSKRDIGCNSNCGAMIGIVANEQGDSANYWTVWDAFCKRGG